MILNPVVYGGKDSGPFSDLKHIGHVDYTSSNWSRGDANFSISVNEPWVADNKGKNVVVYGLYAGAYYDNMVPAFSKTSLSAAVAGLRFWGYSGSGSIDFENIGYAGWSIRNNVLVINVRNALVEDYPNLLPEYSGNCVYFSLDFYSME